MADSFFVDESGLRATVDDLRRLADEGSQMLAALQDAVDHQRQPWGTDETGAQFAKNYVPDADRGMQNLRELVSNLHDLGDSVAAAAESFDRQDALGAAAVDRPNAGDPFAPSISAPPAATIVGPPPAAQTNLVATEAVSPTRATAPVSGVGPTAASPMARKPVSAGDLRSTAPERSALQPNSAKPANAEADGPARQPENTVPQQDSTSEAEPENDGAGPGPTTGTFPSANTSAASNSTHSKDNPPTTETRSGTPWSARGAASNPWARPADGTQQSASPPRVSPPQNGSPPRVSPPRRADRPPRPDRTGAPPKRTGQRRIPERGTPVIDAEALRLVREAAARHGLELSGFDTCGIGMTAARELVAALGALLPEYPNLLRAREGAARDRADAPDETPPRSRRPTHAQDDVDRSPVDAADTPPRGRRFAHAEDGADRDPVDTLDTASSSGRRPARAEDDVDRSPVDAADTPSSGRRPAHAQDGVDRNPADALDEASPAGPNSRRGLDDAAGDPATAVNGTLPRQWNSAGGPDGAVRDSVVALEDMLPSGWNSARAEDDAAVAAVDRGVPGGSGRLYGSDDAERGPAIDRGLPECPKPLRGIEVARRPGPRSRVEVRDVPGGVALWIVLDPDAVVDLALLGNVAGVTEAVAEIGRARPMYATIVREIGAALAISVSEPVRRRVQRELIVEYLRVSGTRISGMRADPLSVIVAGYRGWRDLLGANCFDRCVLRPRAALGAGFAEVELCGAGAGEAARVLHRLVVAAAG
ncbi:hypothetical protein [Nocardia aurantia]|uniref:WXG100 family type VII secretion target n=1 Tax=Nocardia aurantia TaxID=2585199 RepID=A0A7K0DGD3_9NOCA|nr:hypothetical protein [Nocardia aurantia]MQY24748.1 hypothetical protein [Nocardia aurantia]